MNVRRISRLLTSSALLLCGLALAAWLGWTTFSGGGNSDARVNPGSLLGLNPGSIAGPPSASGLNQGSVGNPSITPPSAGALPTLQPSASSLSPKLSEPTAAPAALDIGLTKSPFPDVAG